MAPTSRPNRIVVVAFGPAEVTGAAIARAHRLVAPGGAVVVVPAHRGVAAGGVFGAAALRAALPADDEPVLVLHDDVHIGHDGVRALLRGSRATGEIAVPWINAAGTTPHIPTDVPVDDDARATLARRLPLRGGPAGVVRPLCLVATSTRVRELADRYVTVADARWDDAAVVAKGALAYHAGRCAAARAAADGSPLLVAALIVRDEEELLGDCLASLDGLVDRIEICDTGSVDGTVAIARAAGAHVIEREWRDDFAWARNQVADQCRDASWMLQIDADERARCDDARGLRDRLALLVGSVRVCAVPIDNLDDAGRVGSTHRGARVVRAEGVAYEGALHERARFDDGVDAPALALAGLRLEHVGYRRGIVTARAKADRNMTISERAYDQRPTWETAFNLARSLSMADDQPLARITELLEETLAGGDEVPLTWRAWALARLGRDALTAGDPAAAVTHAQEALALVPADPVAGAVLADAAEQLGRRDLIVAQRSSRRSQRSAQPFSDLAAAAAQLSGLEVTSLLSVGETDEAFAEAAAALRRDPSSFTAWPALVRSVLAADDVDAADAVLVDAALRDRTGRCLTSFATIAAPPRTARLCMRYLHAGGTDERAVRDGLATAIVAGDVPIAQALLADGHRLETQILERLAAHALERGLQAVAAALTDLAEAPRRSFVVCGAAGSATASTAAALSALGHPCGDEMLFDPLQHSTTFGTLQGDASWFALPYLDDLPGDTVIFHQVRDPMAVVHELLTLGALRDPSPATSFLRDHAPHVLAHADELSRCIAYWTAWNTALAEHADGDRPYVRYRVEDLDAEALAQLAGLLGSAQPAAAVRRRLPETPADAARSGAIAQLTDHPLVGDLQQVAAALGYELVGLR